MAPINRHAVAVAMLVAIATAGCVAVDPPAQAEAAVAAPDPAHTVERLDEAEATAAGADAKPAQPVDPAP